MFKKLCDATGKKRYKTKLKAFNAQEKFKKVNADSEYTKIYKCDSCKLWHIGRSESVKQFKLDFKKKKEKSYLKSIEEKEV